VSWGRTGQVAAQVRQGHEGVAQQPQALPHQVDQALVLFTALLVVVVVRGGSGTQNLVVALQEGLKAALQPLELLEHFNVLRRRRVVGRICLWGRCWAHRGWARRGEFWALGWDTLLHFFRLHGLPRRHFAFDWF